MNCPHCGKRIVVEQVSMSPRDSRAAEMAGRAVERGAHALAAIEVQRERQRRASATMPAVRTWRCIQCGDVVREGMTCDGCVAKERCG
jgi:ribosomal protein L32